MERKRFDFSVKQINCIKGGIKEACVIVREYIQNSRTSTSGRAINSPNSAVNAEEFLQAVRVLMAYSWQNRKNDCIPEFWYCDDDCSNVGTYIFCPGEYQICNDEDEKGKILEKKLCPYFRDSADL